MATADKPNVVTTRWWWVRHAPVRNDGGNIYGQSDIACDTSDTYVFNAVAKVLPRKAVWYSSNLMRTHQTAEAIWAAGYPRPESMKREADLAEQNLGRWQGMNRAEFIASRPVGSSWFADINEPAPGGESFMDLYVRTRRTVERINNEAAGQDVIAVAHGGTIKAAIGLALDGQVEKACRSTSTMSRSRGWIISQVPNAMSGGCRWSTSSPGSPTTLTQRCISRRGRK